MIKLKLLIALFAFALTAASSVAQQHYIKRAEYLKAGQKLPLVRSQKLSWGAVKSECLDRVVENGLWVELKSKGPAATLSIISNKKPQLTSLTLYLGEIFDNKGVSEIREIRCSQDEATINKKGHSVFSIGHDKLISDRKYFVLIETEKAGIVLDLEMTNTYTPKDPEIVEENQEGALKILGKATDTQGMAKSGVLLTLVDKNSKSIESTRTEEDGSFKFEKLPIDESVLVKLEAEDADLQINLYLKDEQGKILSKAYRQANLTYGFETPKDAFPQLKLLSKSDWKINVPKGKEGIVGRIVDKGTYLNGQQGVNVELYASILTKIDETTTDKRGKFEFNNLSEKDYSVRIVSDRKGSYSELVYLDDLSVPTKYSNSNMMNSDGFFEFKTLPLELVELNRMEERDFQLSVLDNLLKIDLDQPFILENLLFEVGSASILSSSFAELDGLIEQLKRRPEIKLSVSGHTDNQGAKQTNLALSKSRAKAVYDYLVTHGIAATRLTHQGYGDSRPIATNDTPEGRGKNRRVTFQKLP